MGQLAVPLVYDDKFLGGLGGMFNGSKKTLTPPERWECIMDRFGYGLTPNLPNTSKL